MQTILIEPLLQLGIILGSGDAKVSKPDKVPVLMELIVYRGGQTLVQNNSLICTNQWNLLCRKRIACAGEPDPMWEGHFLQGCDSWAGTLRLTRVSRWGMWVGEDVGRACTKAVQSVTAWHTHVADRGRCGSRGCTLDRWAVEQGVAIVVVIVCVCVQTHAHRYIHTLFTVHM